MLPGINIDVTQRQITISRIEGHHLFQAIRCCPDFPLRINAGDQGIKQSIDIALDAEGIALQHMAFQDFLAVYFNQEQLQFLRFKIIVIFRIPRV
ncbi:MAG: hypothetical protein LRZ88_09095 [Candidatus Cloacimonetes bacterium]|nr:hypothetical protein [Candidatus Cloacimonadota bacterium]